jgi:hypothetical protein
MKKITLIFITILALALTACGATAPQTTPAQTGLDTESKLIIGTLKLEGTQQAVSVEQAQELLVLWQVYQEISQSDTSAPEEVSALLNQIDGSMTAEQTQAINAMNLSQRDVMTVMQEKGLMANMPQRSASTDSSSGGDGFAPPDGGGMAMGAGGPPSGGGMPMGGGMPGGGSSSSSSSNTDTQTTRKSSASLLIDALIEYLQGIAGG